MPVKLVLRLLRRERVKSTTAGLSSSEVCPQRAARHCWQASSGTRCVAAIIGLLFLSGCRHAAKDGGDEEDPKPVVKVEVRPVVRATLDETVEVLGTTQPLKRRTARVTTAMDGRVAAILPEADEPTNGAKSDGATRDKDSPASPASSFQPPASEPRPPVAKQAVEGQMVDQRQVIVRLDDSLARAAVAKAQGALAEAQAALAAQNVPRPQQLQAAEAALASAKSTREAAEAQLKRLKDVETLVGSAQLADAQTAIDRARADERAAAARLAELSDQPAARKAAELQAKVKAAEADLQAAKIQLGLTRVRSPIVGRLSQVSVYLGQSLPAGAPVATVTDLRQVEVLASVPAKRIQQVQVGQSATVLWGDESAPESLPGKVTFVGQEVEPGSGSFPVVIVVQNPDERLQAGLHVQARIIVRHLENVLAVPQTAVIEETDEPCVFLAVKAKEKGHDEKDSDAKQGTPESGDKSDEKRKTKDDDKPALVARKVPIKPLVRSGDLVQIEGEGIQAGDLVVTKGGYALPDEAQLEIDSSDEKTGAGEKPESAPKAAASSHKPEA